MPVREIGNRRLQLLLSTGTTSLIHNHSTHLNSKRLCPARGGCLLSGCPCQVIASHQLKLLFHNVLLVSLAVAF
jgi:hypothetical protein